MRKRSEVEAMTARAGVSSLPQLMDLEHHMKVQLMARMSDGMTESEVAAVVAEIASEDRCTYTGPSGQPVSQPLLTEAFKRMLMQLPGPLMLFATACASAMADQNRDPETKQTTVRLDTYFEVANMVADATEALALAVYRELPPSDKEALNRLIVDRLRKEQSLKEVQDVGRKAIRNLIDHLVAQEMEAAKDVLMHRIQQLVEERWEAEVEAVVQKRVADAIAKIKSEVTR